MKINVIVFLMNNAKLRVRYHFINVRMLMFFDLCLSLKATFNHPRFPMPFHSVNNQCIFSPSSAIEIHKIHHSNNIHPNNSIIFDRLLKLIN